MEGMIIADTFTLDPPPSVIGNDETPESSDPTADQITAAQKVFNEMLLKYGAQYAVEGHDDGTPITSSTQPHAPTNARYTTPLARLRGTEGK
jgi:hypothetical protein